jgi:hypothetical protein
MTFDIGLLIGTLSLGAALSTRLVSRWYRRQRIERRLARLLGTGSAF